MSEPVSNTPSKRSIDRRRFGALMGAGAAALSTPAIAQAPARVVVIGGGPGGASTAKRIAENGAGRVDVTLIVDEPSYTTCFFSNLYLAGFRSLRSISFGYDALAARDGLTLVTGLVADVDREARLATLADGAQIGYDRLVLAPGVGFRSEAIEGYDSRAAEAMPHAWRAGYQTFLLRQRLLDMRRGGVFAICPPPAPYRCPPGPYERASLAALLLARVNRRATVLIIDSKESFPKQELFEQIWAEHNPGNIRWVSAAETGGGLARVDADAMTLFTQDGQSLAVDAACVIPPQRAADLAVAAGLVDDSGWAPVAAETMRSTIDDAVFVVGDSAKARPMPKSAFSALSQAAVAANAVLASLELTPLFPAQYRNTCWSFASWQQAVKVGGSYRAADGAFEQISSFSSDLDEAPEARLQTALEANGWYFATTREMFG